MLMPDAQFERLIAGQPPFAKGTSREVFRVPIDGLVVIKRQRIAPPGANFLEQFLHEQAGLEVVRSRDVRRRKPLDVHFLQADPVPTRSIRAVAAGVRSVFW